MARTRGPGPPYEPTARDIQRACERISAGWSERERDKRAGRSKPSSWTPPTVNYNDLTSNIIPEHLANQTPSTQDLTGYQSQLTPKKPYFKQPTQDYQIIN